jgi:hypothetical protein
MQPEPVWRVRHPLGHPAFLSLLPQRSGLTFAGGRTPGVPGLLIETQAQKKPCGVLHRACR